MVGPTDSFLLKPRCSKGQITETNRFGTTVFGVALFVSHSTSCLDNGTAPKVGVVGPRCIDGRTGGPVKVRSDGRIGHRRVDTNVHPGSTPDLGNPRGSDLLEGVRPGMDRHFLEFVAVNVTRMKEDAHDAIVTDKLAKTVQVVVPVALR